MLYLDKERTKGNNKEKGNKISKGKLILFIWFGLSGFILSMLRITGNADMMPRIIKHIPGSIILVYFLVERNYYWFTLILDGLLLLVIILPFVTDIPLIIIAFGLFLYVLFSILLLMLGYPLFGDKHREIDPSETIWTNIVNFFRIK